MSKFEKILPLMLMLIPALCNSEELKFITHEHIPFTWREAVDGTMKGLVYDLCRETILRMGYSNPKIAVYPFLRGLQTVQSQDNIVMFHVGRTAEREATLKWVGPIVRFGVFFYIHKSVAPVPVTLEDFKKLASIGVVRGGSSHDYLLSRGFTNIHDVVNESNVVGMLALGRVEAILTGELVVNELIKHQTVDASQFTKTNFGISESVLYLGFSKNIPDEEIARWQMTFDLVKKEQYQRLYDLYILH